MMRYLCISLSFILCSMSYAQSITSINPNSAIQGEVLTVTITGQSTHFGQGSSTTIPWFSQGSATTIYPDFVNVNSPTSMDAQFSFSGNASTGFYDVNTFNVYDGYLSLNNGFYLVADPTPPSIIAVEPDTAQQGQTLSVSISGQNTHFGQGTGTTDVWFDQSSSTIIHPTSTQIISTDSINAEFSIPVNAPLGHYDVNVYDYLDGEVALLDGFYVKDTNTAVIYRINEDYIKVYPIPFTDHLTVAFTGPATPELEINLVDIKGRIIQHFGEGISNAGQSKIYLDIQQTGLSSGIYFLQIKSGSRNYLQKLIKR